MEEKIKMLHRFPCRLSVFLFLLTACTGPVLSGPTDIGPTVTYNPIASPSLTPFAPPVTTPTFTATISPLLATATPIPIPIPTPTPTETFTQTPASVLIASLYTLNVKLDYVAHSMTVDESVFYQNATGETLSSLVLAVEPNLWKGCFTLGSLTVNAQAVTGLSLNSDRLDIPLAQPLIAGGTLNLSLHFDLHLPAADVHHVFGYNDHQTNLVDWYPFIVPYSGGWLLHPPAQVGEHLAYDTAAFDVTVTLTDPALSVTLAASAPAEAAAGSWHFRLQNARTFVFSASTAYQTVSTTSGGVTVTSYYFGEEKTQAQVVLDEAAGALRTFAALFGPSPYTTLSIVESPFYDGMEYDGLFFLSRDFYAAYDGTVLNNLIDIDVHETAHQWWFGLVGNDQAQAPWLDEALATYSEELFYEKNYPAVTAWWAFRVDAYMPTGWVDTDIYHGGNFRTYANAVYLRGAQFLKALRGRIGDEAFFAFLKDYAAQMAGKRATPADFFRILREHTNADLSELISSYFQQPY